MAERQRIPKPRAEDHRGAPTERNPLAYLERHAGQPLAPELRAHFEPRFQHDFSRVRVHGDHEAAGLADDLEASAFTVGQDIVFGGGRFEPHTVVGQRLIAHELAHTVQQADALPSAALRVAQPNEGSELEAARAAGQVLGGGTAGVGRGGETVIAREKKEDSASEQAALEAGNLPWLRMLSPDWAWRLSGEGLTGTTTDGTTTRTQHADMSLRDGFGFKLGQGRTVQTDKDHMMSSNHELSLEDGMVGWGWGGAGRSLADDGTKVADSQQSKIGVAKDGFALENTSSSTRDTVTSARSMNASMRDGKWQVGVEGQRSFALDDDHQLSSSTGASLGSDGARVTHTSSSRIKDAELNGVVNADQKSTSVGYGKNGLELARSTSQTTEVGNEKFTTGSQLGYSDGQVSYSRSREHVVTDEAGKESKHSSAFGGSVGKDGVGMNYSSQGEHGKRSVGVTVGPDSMGMSGSMTTAGGTKVGGGVSVKDGNLEANAGIERKGVSVSVSGSDTVTTGEPRKVGDHFVVDWAHTLKGGAGGGARGVKAGGSTSEQDFGSSSFATLEAALEFKAHAAERIGRIASADTVQGALALGIGERRGHASDQKVSAGGSLSVAGGGSFGASGSVSSGQQLSVHRVSDTIFEVTAVDTGGRSGEAGASTFAGGAQGHAASDTSSSRTLRFDLSSAEGKAAFEAYNRDPSQIPSSGARVVSSTESKGSEHGTTVSLLGGAHTNDRTSRTEEAVTQDERGKTERYTGIAREDVSTDLPFLGGDHNHTSTRFDATETNDRHSRYALSGSVDASSGEDSMESLAEITGMVYKDTAGAKSSGKWGVEVEITEAMVNEFVKNVSDEQIRAMGIFDGSDPRNDLRLELRAAKTSDDRKRALAKFMAEAGHDGKAIKQLRNVLWGVVNQNSLSGDYEMMKRNKRGNFNYDLTLPGDRNFGGLEARQALEAKISGFESALEKPETAAGLHTEVAATLQEVTRQRREIADPKRYTDLPHELRERQLARLDQTLERLRAIEVKSAQGMIQQAPSEDSLEDLQAAKAQISDPKQFKGLTKEQRRNQTQALNAKIKTAQSQQANLTPDQIALRKLRGEIKDAESYLKDDKQEYHLAEQSFKQMSKELLKSGRAGSGTAREARKLETEARALMDKAKAFERGVNEARTAFLGALGNPQRALALGGTYLGLLQVALELWSQAETKMSAALEGYIAASTEDAEEPERPEPVRRTSMAL